MDCYGAPEVIGKIGTDIMDNKCSWLINQALDRASSEQRALLEACTDFILISTIKITRFLSFVLKSNTIYGLPG